MVPDSTSRNVNITLKSLIIFFFREKVYFRTFLYQSGSRSAACCTSWSIKTTQPVKCNFHEPRNNMNMQIKEERKKKMVTESETTCDHVGCSHDFVFLHSTRNSAAKVEANRLYSRRRGENEVAKNDDAQPKHGKRHGGRMLPISLCQSLHNKFYRCTRRQNKFYFLEGCLTHGCFISLFIALLVPIAWSCLQRKKLNLFPARDASCCSVALGNDVDYECGSWLLRK